MEKRTITAKIRKQMEGLLPFSSDSKFPYTPKRFKKEGLPKSFIPTFTLRSFTKPERDEARLLMKRLTEATDDELDGLTTQCVMGWKQMFDLGTGEEAVYKASQDGGADLEAFQNLSRKVRSDIFYKLLEVGGLIDLELLALK